MTRRPKRGDRRKIYARLPGTQMALGYYGRCLYNVAIKYCDERGRFFHEGETFERCLQRVLGASRWERRVLPVAIADLQRCRLLEEGVDETRGAFTALRDFVETQARPSMHDPAYREWRDTWGDRVFAWLLVDEIDILNLPIFIRGAMAECIRQAIIGQGLIRHGLPMVPSLAPWFGCRTRAEQRALADHLAELERLRFVERTPEGLSVRNFARYNPDLVEGREEAVVEPPADREEAATEPPPSHDETATKPRRSRDEATVEPRRDHDEAATKPRRDHSGAATVALSSRNHSAAVRDSDLDQDLDLGLGSREDTHAGSGDPAGVPDPSVRLAEPEPAGSPPAAPAEPSPPLLLTAPSPPAPAGRRGKKRGGARAYTAEFEAAWKAYREETKREDGKPESFDAWTKEAAGLPAGERELQGLVVASLAYRRLRSEEWRRGVGVPWFERYLTGQRYRVHLEAQADDARRAQAEHEQRAQAAAREERETAERRFRESLTSWQFIADPDFAEQNHARSLPGELPPPGDRLRNAIDGLFRRFMGAWRDRHKGLTDAELRACSPLWLQQYLATNDPRAVPRVGPALERDDAGRAPPRPAVPTPGPASNVVPLPTVTVAATVETLAAAMSFSDTPAASRREHERQRQATAPTRRPTRGWG